MGDRVRRVRRIRGAALLASVLALAAAGTVAGAAPAPSDVRIADSGVYPESLSADRAGRLYIGSIKGIVYRTAPNGDVAEPWIQPTAQNGILSILGVLVDEPSRTLWICSSPMPLRTPPSVGTSSVMAFALATGKLKASYPLPTPAGACNDISVAPDRSIYLTDTPNGRIFRLRPGDKALTLFAQDDRMKGVDGIAFSASGKLYVNNVITNQMQRVDRNADGSFKDLTLLTLSQPIAGPDGLRLLSGESFLQAEGRSGKITRVDIGDDRANIVVLKDGLDSSPGVTPARHAAYAVEGKIRFLIDKSLKGQEPPPFVARAIDLGGDKAPAQ